MLSDYEKAIHHVEVTLANEVKGTIWVATAIIVASIFICTKKIR